MSYGNDYIKKIYYLSPYMIKNFIASIYGFFQRHDRYGVTYKKYKQFLFESQYWTNEELINYRDEKTIDFINYSIENNEFYRTSNLYHKINSITELKDFPIINKKIIRANLEKLKNNKIRIPYRLTHTSGTTGSSIIFPLSDYCFQREYAFRTIHYLWSGVDLRLKPKIATFSGHPVANPKRKKRPFWAYDFVNNWLLFSSYHISDDLVRYYIEELIKFNPVLIHGYPSSVYLISLAFKKYGKKLSNLKSIYTASETLMDFQRKAIEDAFQVKVYNWYGNSEMCANIVECENGRLHLKYEHSFVEILNYNNQQCKPGEKGRLVCTGFGNPAFPLIRYNIKDEVIISEEEKCPCGRGGLLIKEVVGRVEDYIITPSGRKIGRLDHIFKDTLHIKEAQIYQGKTDEIELRIVPENSKINADDEKKIWQEVRLRFSDEINVKIVPLKKIERSPNNKFRFIVSELAKEND